jgi:hypothetical protein
MGREDELLIGLHQCTDSTEEIVRSFSDSRLRTITYGDISFSEVLNGLVAEARYDIVARMDADDICLPWRYSLQRSLIKRHPNHLIFSTALVEFRIGHFLRIILPQYPFTLDSSQVYELLVKANPLNHPTLIVSKQLIECLGGYVDVPGEDLHLWLRAALSNQPILRHALPVIVYRFSHTQLSRKRDYSEGWKKNAAIASMRMLLQSSNPHLRSKSCFKSLVTQLHIEGLSIFPNRLRQILGLRIKN